MKLIKDKIDYILRDSHITNVSKKFQKNDIERIQNHTDIHIMETDGLLYTRIVYSDKIRDLLANIFDDRIVLHKKCYQHKTTLAVASMMFGILQAANEHLKFKGSDGLQYKMTDAFNNIDAFLKMDDSRIRAMILQLADAADVGESIKEANSILQKLEYRQLPKFVYSLHLKTTVDVKHACDEIASQLISIEPELRSHIFVELVSLDKGQGLMQSPMNSFMYFENKHPTNIISDCKYGSQNSGGTLHAYIYLSFEKRDALRELVRNAVKTLEEHDETFLFKRKRRSSTHDEVLREINSDYEEGPKRMRDAESNESSKGSSFSSLSNE